MDTPTQSEKERVESVLKQFKPEIRELSGYVSPPQKKVFAKLNQNENPYDIPLSMKEAVFQEMKDLSWARYPEYNPLKLREKIGERFKVAPEQVLLGNGSNQLLYTVISAVISPWDTIVTSSPSFSLFELAGRIAQGRIISVPQNHDFSLDKTTLIESLRNARLTLLCSPNNPTGKPIEIEFLKECLEATSGIILWDEAYGEFGGESAIPLLNHYPNLVILKTFSKAFGLAGLRVGFLIAHSEIAKQLQKINLPYNLNLFSTVAALHLMEAPELVETHVKKIVTEREKLFNKMKKISGVVPFPSEANFILFKVKDGTKILRKLEEQGILVRDMSGYSVLKNFLRVTVGTPEENSIFLETLSKIIYGE